MNSKGIVAIPRDKANCYCMNCLKETSDLKNITICEMGYGSAFDGAGTKINLCNECYEKSNPEIWSMEVKRTDYYEEYLHEKEMLDYIEKLPLQCRELIYNEFEYGWDANYTMEPQDWIDYQLDELPYEKCKQYGLYAPEEIRAYEERYPKCEYVYNRVWRDGSKGSSCAMQNCTSGEYGGKLDVIILQNVINVIISQKGQHL